MIVISLNARKIISYKIVDDVVIALADDGTLWRHSIGTTITNLPSEWHPFPMLPETHVWPPQPERAKKRSTK